MMMQDFFARAVDLIALAGPDGTLLSHVATAAASCTDRSAQHSSAPRPAHVKWLHASLLEYPKLFHIQPVAASGPSVDEQRAGQAAPAQLLGDVRVTACDPLQTRALGISPLEHATLPPNAQRVMRLVGAAGQKGIIQADLPGLLGVPVGSAHHYLVTAIHSDLVARCRVFIEKKVSSTTAEDSAPSLSSRIVLARFASTFLFSPEDERGTADFPVYEEKVAASLASRARVIVDALGSQANHVMTERELKAICMPDRNPNVGPPQKQGTQRFRHKTFRLTCHRMMGARIVAKELHHVIDVFGKDHGQLPCLRLLVDPADITDAILKSRLAGVAGEHALSPERVLSTATRESALLVDVDLPQQAFSLLKNAGPDGMSVVDLWHSLSPFVSKKHAKSLLVAVKCAISTAREREQYYGRSLRKVLAFAPSIEGGHQFDGDDLKGNPPDPCGVTSEARFTVYSPRGAGHPEPIANALTTDEDVVANGVPVHEAESKDCINAHLTDDARLSVLGARRAETLLNWLREHNLIPMDRIGRYLAFMEGNVRIHVDKRVVARIVTWLRQSGLTRVIPIKKVLPKGCPDMSVCSAQSTALVLSSFDDSGTGADAAINKALREFSSFMRTKRKRAASEQSSNVRRLQKCASVELGQKPSSTGKNGPAVDVNMAPTSSQPVRVVVQQHVPLVPMKPRTHDPNVNSGQNRCLVVTEMARSKTDVRSTRISRVIALDYGWCKALFHRARLFHMTMYKVLTDTGSPLLASEPSLAENRSHDPDSETSRFIGTIAEHEVLDFMNVQVFANVIGIFFDLGDVFPNVRETLVGELPTKLRATLHKSPQAVLQVKTLISILYRLELILPSACNRWAVCCFGTLRDFGKGMPDGMKSQTIALHSAESVELFWKHLEAFKNIGSGSWMDSSSIPEKKSPLSQTLVSASVAEHGTKISFVERSQIVTKCPLPIPEGCADSQFDEVVPCVGGAATEKSFGYKHRRQLFEIYEEHRWNTRTEFSLSEEEEEAVERQLQLYLRRRTPSAVYSCDPVGTMSLDNIYDEIGIRLGVRPPHRKVLCGKAYAAVSLEKVARYIRWRATNQASDQTMTAVSKSFSRARMKRSKVVPPSKSATRQAKTRLPRVPYSGRLAINVVAKNVPHEVSNSESSRLANVDVGRKLMRPVKPLEGQNQNGMSGGLSLTKHPASNSETSVPFYGAGVLKSGRLSKKRALSKDTLCRDVVLLAWTSVLRLQVECQNALYPRASFSDGKEWYLHGIYGPGVHPDIEKLWTNIAQALHVSVDDCVNKFLELCENSLIRSTFENAVLLQLPINSASQLEHCDLDTAPSPTQADAPNLNEIGGLIRPPAAVLDLLRTAVERAIGGGVSCLRSRPKRPRLTAPSGHVGSSLVASGDVERKSNVLDANRGDASPENKSPSEWPFAINAGDSPSPGCEGELNSVEDAPEKNASTLETVHEMRTPTAMSVPDVMDCRDSTTETDAHRHFGKVFTNESPSETRQNFTFAVLAHDIFREKPSAESCDDVNLTLDAIAVELVEEVLKVILREPSITFLAKEAVDILRRFHLVDLERARSNLLLRKAIARTPGDDKGRMFTVASASKSKNGPLNFVPGLTDSGVIDGTGTDAPSASEGRTKQVSFGPAKVASTLAVHSVSNYELHSAVQSVFFSNPGEQVSLILESGYSHQEDAISGHRGQAFPILNRRGVGGLDDKVCIYSHSNEVLLPWSSLQPSQAFVGLEDSPSIKTYEHATEVDNSDQVRSASHSVTCSRIKISSSIRLTDDHVAVNAVHLAVEESSMAGIFVHEFRHFRECVGLPLENIAKAIYVLLSNRIIERLPVNNRTPSAADVGGCTSLYMLREHAIRISRSCIKALDNRIVSETDEFADVCQLLSGWSNLSGELDTVYCNTVQARVLGTLARSPGISECALFEQVAMPDVSRRCILDILWVLEYYGLVVRKFSKSASNTCLLLCSKPSPAISRIASEPVATEFLDGMALSGCGLQYETFYFLSGRAIGNLVPVSFLADIGRRIPRLHVPGSLCDPA